MSKSYTIARLERGETFEILVDPDTALKVKMGEKLPISKVLVYEEIYKDARKGIKVGETELKKVFGTTDKLGIAEKILAEGEVQITSDQRRRLIEEKRKKIVDFISKNAVDPRTKLPHPPMRIENALAEVGASIDPFIDAKEQASKIIEKLRTVIPLKFGLNKMEVRIPGELMGKSYGVIKSMGKIIKEEWKGDGSWACQVEIPTGLHLDLIDKLNKLCAGRVETNLIE